MNVQANSGLKIINKNWKKNSVLVDITHISIM